jgi:hypothetical protein
MSGRSVEDVLTRPLRRGQLRPATAIDRIQRASTGLTRIGIQDGLAALARDNRITGVTINGQVVGMVGWREAPVEAPNPLLLDWQNAVSAICELDPERRAALMRPPTDALALAEEDRHALIECLSMAFPHSQNSCWGKTTETGRAVHCTPSPPDRSCQRRCYSSKIQVNSRRSFVLAFR